MGTPANAAAAQIVGLINSRVQSPRLEEIEAIIAAVAPPAPSPDDDVMSILKEWRGLVTDWCNAATRADVKETHPEYAALQSALSIADDRMETRLDELIRDAPNHGWTYLAVLADAAYGPVFDIGKGGLFAPDAVQTIEATAAAGYVSPPVRELFKAIRALTLRGAPEPSCPQLPLYMPPSPCDTQGVERIIAAIEAEQERGAPDTDKLDSQLEALALSAWAEAPKSPAALRSAALIAKHWHTISCFVAETGKGWDGHWEKPSDCEHHEQMVVAQLIQAVLAFTETTPEMAASLERLEQWRAAVGAYNAVLVRPDHTDEDVYPHYDRIRDMTVALEKAPVRNVVDLLLKAEVGVEWNTPDNAGNQYPECIIGRQEGEVDGPELDRVALAHLVKGVFNLLGVPIPRCPG